MKQFGLLHILASLLLFHQFVCPDKKVSLLHYQVVWVTEQNVTLYLKLLLELNYL